MSEDLRGIVQEDPRCLFDNDLKRLVIRCLSRRGINIDFPFCDSRIDNRITVTGVVTTLIRIAKAGLRVRVFVRYQVTTVARGGKLFGQDAIGISL